MEFIASAPCKAILFGEHYVVYGSPALALAIEPRNKVEFAGWEGDGIALKSELGNGVILPSGEYDGPSELEIYPEVARRVFGSSQLPSCAAKFEPAWKLKGVGTSASLCAAFAAGLFRLAGKTAGPDEIFAAAQAGDLVAHGGRASGIDAKTVSFGMPLIFQRKFNPDRFESEISGFRLPSGSALLLIDTFSGKKDGTVRMLEVFASQFGIAGKPSDASEEQRQAVRDEYSPIWEKLAPVLKNPDAKAIGELMNENHALLKNRRVSSPGIETAVSAASGAGAYGAKFTGAGGEGGAVLALCSKEKAAAVSSEIKTATGFACRFISLATSGARAD